jgi:TonB family protein
MRCLLAVPAAALVLATVSAVAAAPSPDPLLTFYPLAARAAGISGAVVLRCGRTDRGALAHCQVASENPAGHGFGAAALAMAAKSVPNCSQPPPDMQRHSRDLGFIFDAAPLAIAPNVLQPGWSVESPQWGSLPNHGQFGPEGAASAHVHGKVVLMCRANGLGRLQDCRVIAAQPPGWGFDASALEVSKLVRLAPTTCDGRRVDGEWITVPVDFDFH